MHRERRLVVDCYRVREGWQRKSRTIGQLLEVLEKDREILKKAKADIKSYNQRIKKKNRVKQVWSKH